MPNELLSRTWIEAGVVEGARVLWASPEPVPPALRATGATVTETRRVDPLDFAAESFDDVLLDDVFGRHEWDRWLLQEVQRVLVPGGRVFATVPNIRCIESPSDWAFLLGRARVQFDRRLRRMRGLPPREYPFHGRRYRVEEFLELLPPLGFERVACHPSPGAGRPRCFVVSASAGPSRFGVGESRPWPEPAAHRARYEAANAQFLSERDRWLAASGLALAPPAPMRPDEVEGPVLVLAPHPDDEIIGCGGTLARVIAAGGRVHCLQATDGSEGAALRDVPDDRRRSIRLAEAAEVGRTIGFADVVFWRADNGHFRATDELVARMVALLDEVRPRWVFTPFVADLHPDHFTLNRILARALERSPRELRVFQYEVWGLVPANAWCDVTAESARLEQLLRLYHTAMKVDDFVHFCEDRNLHHSIRHAGRVGLAESFLESDAARFVTMVRAGENARGL